MRILLLMTFLTSFGLLSSCDKKADNKTTDGKQSELKLEDRIFDHAHFLTKEQADSIFQIIKDLNSGIGSQIAIITIDTLNGVPLNQFSLDKANELGLGRDKIHDGILIVAVKNHATRIEVGYGLEKIIRDEIAARIIREDMNPKFRVGNFSGALKSGVSEIKKLIEDNRELVGQRF